MMVPILYSEIFDSKPTRDDLRAMLTRVDWHYAIMFAVGVSSISWQRGIEDPRQQQDLAANTLGSLSYGQRLLQMMAAEPYRKIYTREGLFGIVRTAAEAQAVVLQPPTDTMDVLVRAVLMANEITSDELLPASITHTAADLTKSEVRSNVLKLQNPHDLLARTDAFMRWSETADGRGSADHLPIADDIRRFFGLSWHEYAASAYIMLSRYASLTDWAAVEREKVFFAPGPWLQNMREDAPIRQWLAVSTIRLSDVTEAWRSETSISLASAGPLFRQPVVETDDNLFAPSPSLLVNAMGEGVYFALFDSYGTETGDSAKKLRLSRFYGDFFEAYITDILSRSYAARSDSTVYPAFPYAGGESTDIIVAENGDMLFVEVVAKRMKFVESVLRLNESAILGDIAAGVVKKMEEMHKHIGNFRKGTLLPDIPRSSNQRIFPIIVSPNEWPRIRILSEVVPAVQEEKGFLVGVEPLELVDAGELESLENDLKRGLRLSELLTRKNRSTQQNRMMSLNNYLYYIEPHTSADEPSPTRQRGSDVAREIGAIGMSWFRERNPFAEGQVAPPPRL
jgi:hypothetical protein